jgi:DNA-binding XRE family transcriptional regulator
MRKCVDLRRHIDKLRGERSLTQFAKDIGVTRQTLYNVMDGTSEPSARLLKALGLARNLSRARKEAETAA